MFAEDREGNQLRHQITKVKPAECHGHLLEYYREGAILVIVEEMSLVVNLKVDLVEEQIDEEGEKGLLKIVICNGI